MNCQINKSVQQGREDIVLVTGYGQTESDR